MTNIFKLLDEVKPDVMCLQETFTSDQMVATPERVFNSLDLIQERSGLKYRFFSPTFTSVYSGVTASFGNAILSRVPLEDTKTVFTNGAYVPDYNPKTYDINIRNLQLASLSVDGVDIIIANHHGHWVIDPLGDEISIEKMKSVMHELKQVHLPLIFAGDLNLKSESEAMRVFDNTLEDLTAIHHIPTTLSVVGKVTNVACDHILISPEVEVQRFEALDDLVSDHKALLLDFSLKK
jgi:endonuclease/exonuclease/phosphatase family metal-dependent hydrolase